MSKKLSTVITEAALLPTFNFYSLSQLEGIMAALNEAQKPALIGVSSRCWNAIDKKLLKWLASEYIPEKSNGLGFTHLDHGWSIEAVTEAIELGFKSVMFDGSKLNLSKNIELSKKAYDIARSKGICIEGEVGIVGRPGLDSTTTSEEEALSFYKQIPVDYLAISIGTFHGAEPDKFDVDLAKNVHQKTGAKLALHGGSGVGDDNLKKAVQVGFYKFNFASDIDRTEQKFYSELDENYRSRKSDEIQIMVADRVKEYCLNKFRVLYDGYSSN